MLLKIGEIGTRSGGFTKRRYTKTYFLLFVVLPFIVLLGGLSATYHFGTKENVTFKVQEKEAIGGYQSGQYLIYGEEEVFENADSLWEMKWNSSDVYRQIEPGKCYRTEAWGWRIPFFSMYRTIDQVEKIPCP